MKNTIVTVKVLLSLYIMLMMLHSCIKDPHKPIRTEKGWELTRFILEFAPNQSAYHFQEHTFIYNKLHKPVQQRIRSTLPYGTDLFTLENNFYYDKQQRLTEIRSKETLAFNLISSDVDYIKKIYYVGSGDHKRAAANYVVSDGGKYQLSDSTTYSYLDTIITKVTRHLLPPGGIDTAVYVYNREHNLLDVIGTYKGNPLPAFRNKTYGNAPNPFSFLHVKGLELELFGQLEHFIVNAYTAETYAMLTAPGISPNFLQRPGIVYSANDSMVAQTFSYEDGEMMQTFSYKMIY